LAIIFCAWAIISGVIMLGSMVFTGAGACDARVPRVSELCAREGTVRRSIDGGESFDFPRWFPRFTDRHTMPLNSESRCRVKKPSFRPVKGRTCVHGTATR